MNTNTQTFKLFDTDDWMNEPVYFSSFQNSHDQNQGYSPTTLLSFNTHLYERDKKLNNHSSDNILNLLFLEISSQTTTNFSQSQVYQEHFPDDSRAIETSVTEVPNNNSHYVKSNNHYMEKKVLSIAPKLHCNTPYPMKSSSTISTSKEVTEKRQKNTNAARRSRLKKIIKMENLERQVDELNTENSKLKTRMVLLESENRNYISKNTKLEKRLVSMETRLAEAHKVLASKLLPHTD